MNPYKFGMVGNTDSHTSLSAVEEDNCFGKHSGVEPYPERALHVTLGGEQGKIMGYHLASSGYAAVWAQENTRDAIFEALTGGEVSIAGLPATRTDILARFNRADPRFLELGVDAL